jgi:hypothetical protein
MSAWSILIGLLLLVWVFVAWALLVGLHRYMPEESIDWRDQLSFALWPIAIPLAWAWDVWQRSRKGQSS